MGIGLALLGIAIGAAGVEVLRAKKPEIIDKVEGAAKGFVESMYPKTPEGDTENSAEQTPEDTVDNNTEQTPEGSGDNNTEEELKD